MSCSTDPYALERAIAISVEAVGELEHVHISIRGVPAGILVVERGDGATIAALLRPFGDRLAEEARKRRLGSDG